MIYFREFVNNAVVNELTVYDFTPEKKLKGLDIKFLKSFLPKSAKSVKEATKRLLGYYGEEMFTDIQFHKITDTDGTNYLLHQMNYWLRDSQVNVTQLSISKYESDWDSDWEDVCEAYVSTDIFFDEVESTKEVVTGSFGASFNLK